MQLKTCLAVTKNNGAVLRHFVIDTTRSRRGGKPDEEMFAITGTDHDWIACGRLFQYVYEWFLVE